MKIYINTIHHAGFDDDIESLNLCTTFPMSKHEFVKYFNKNIAGKNTKGYGELGVYTDISRFDGEYPWRTKKFPKIVLEEDEDEDGYYCDLRFADDTGNSFVTYYRFYSKCVSLVDTNVRKERNYEQN